MKFVDTLTLTVSSGNGGNGAVSFRREKYVPKGGPDGGHGGNGGNVIIRADKGKQTLLDLRYKTEYKAENGAKGKGRDQAGRTGTDLIILVPFGTIVVNNETGEEIADVSEENSEFILLHGGRGGRGNTAFVSATHRTPRTAEPGGPGETLTIRLELKLIADVGIVGYPNAGKSTFISVVSAARPKVADYPFTTLTPVLGVVKDVLGGSFVIADMPGLIEGAHEGVGLGLRFLRHIERTRVLLHFIDAAAEESMIDRYLAIRRELELYSDDVAAKPEIIVATKADSAIAENLSEFRKYLAAQGKELKMISSVAGTGVKELLECIGKALAEVSPAETDESSASER